MTHCLNCKTKTTNPKFCSSHCAAVINGRLYPKRRTKKKCFLCNKPVSTYRRNRCEEHWLEYKEQKYKHRTLGEYRTKLSVTGKHPSWLHSHIRAFARSWNKKLLAKPCAVCGYNKHVELCHKKPVSTFPNSTKLSIVNSEKNIVQLCRNCHWEFDNGLLRLP